MEILIWILAAYGMSQILVFGAIFDKPRNWITKHSTFLGDLLGCMMCTSTWVGFLYSVVFYSPTGFYTSTALINIPYLNILLDGMVASGGVWTLNAIVEWFEENRPQDSDSGPGVV